MILFSQPLVLSALAAGRPLTNARICWQSHVRDRDLTAAAVTVSSEADEGPRDAPLRDETAEYWLPTALPATWTLDLGAGLDLDYVGVAGHTIGSEACSLKVETSTDNINWTLFDVEHAPADDTPILFLEDSRTARYIRLTLQGLGEPARIAVIRPGVALAMPVPVDGPYTPINLARESELKAQFTRGGQFLGQSVRRHGVKGDAKFKLLDAAFVRSEFDLFAKSARQYPYFFAWNPQDFPLEIGYCWSDKDIKPKYMGMGDLMEVSWQMAGVGAA